MSSTRVPSYPRLRKRRMEVSIICCRNRAFLRSRSPSSSPASAVVFRDARHGNPAFPRTRETVVPRAGQAFRTFFVGIAEYSPRQTAVHRGPRAKCKSYSNMIETDVKTATLQSSVASLLPSSCFPRRQRPLQRPLRMSRKCTWDRWVTSKERSYFVTNSSSGFERITGLKLCRALARHTQSLREPGRFC